MNYNSAINQWSPEQWQQFGASGGVIDGNNNLVGGSMDNPMTSYLNTSGLGGITQGNWNNMGQAAGLAGTAYGLYDSLFGQSAKKNKLQMEGLRQNIDFAKKANDSHYKFTGNIGKGFEGAFPGGGLAASAAQPKVG